MTKARNVVLLHGLFMRPIIMQPLAFMLRKHGHNVSLYGYPTTSASLSANAENFSRWLSTQEYEVDVVAHSLGALVTLQAIQSIPSSNIRRFVALGPPFNGSIVGRNLSNNKLGSALLGESKQSWLERPLSIPSGWDVGVIAGNISLGVGKIFTRLPVPNDGVVSVAETELPDAKESIIVKSTHTAIIFSPYVAKLTSNFLTEGKFRA